MDKKSQTQMKLNAARMRIIQTKEFMGKRVLSLVYSDVPGIDEDVTHKYIIEQKLNSPVEVQDMYDEHHYVHFD